MHIHFYVSYSIEPNEIGHCGVSRRDGCTKSYVSLQVLYKAGWIPDWLAEPSCGPFYMLTDTRWLRVSEQHMSNPEILVCIRAGLIPVQADNHSTSASSKPTDFGKTFCKIVSRPCPSTQLSPNPQLHLVLDKQLIDGRRRLCQLPAFFSLSLQIANISLPFLSFLNNDIVILQLRRIMPGTPTRERSKNRGVGVFFSYHTDKGFTSLWKIKIKNEMSYQYNDYCQRLWSWCHPSLCVRTAPVVSTPTNNSLSHHQSHQPFPKWRKILRQFGLLRLGDVWNKHLNAAPYGTTCTYMRSIRL